jgi:hypothetical protein
VVKSFRDSSEVSNLNEYEKVKDISLLSI